MPAIVKPYGDVLRNGYSLKLKYPRKIDAKKTTKTYECLTIVAIVGMEYWLLQQSCITFFAISSTPRQPALRSPPSCLANRSGTQPASVADLQVFDDRSRIAAGDGVSTGSIRITHNDGKLTRYSEAENIARRFVNRLLRLTLLAPGIQEAILAGRQAKGVQFKEPTRVMTSEWGEQRLARKVARYA